MSQAEKIQKIKVRDSSESNSSQNIDDSDNDNYDSSFIQNDEQIDEKDYVHRVDFTDKQKIKKTKKKRKRENGDEFDQGDYEILEEEQSAQGLHRLKKQKKQTNRHQVVSDEQDIQFEQGDELQDYESKDRSQGSYYNNLMREQAIQQEQSFHEIADIQNQVFQVGDMRKFYIESEDKQIVNVDLPEREFIQIKNYAKFGRKSIEQAIKQFEMDDKNIESKWIYEKLKILGYLEGYDERLCREKIKNVLQELHRQHLEIMYIYYYRKKVYSDVLNLQLLWKILELDEQWLFFKQELQKMNDCFINVISSLQDGIPKSLEDMLNRCTDNRILQYFKQYKQYMLSKMGQNIQINQNLKNSLVAQIHDRKINQWLEKTEIFLTPEYLCFNLKNRMQDKKPKTPLTQPKQQLEKVFKNWKPQNDKIRFPLLVPQKRLQSIVKYLEIQLFNYPQLHKILKDKYYKKLVITTSPTLKGNHDINLYSIFYPIKRIKDKPIFTLKRQIWILALQAQKLDLIKIDLKFQWQLSTENRNFQSDSVYLEMVKYYFDISVHKSGEIWNLFRKSVLTKMLEHYFFPAFMKQVRDDLTRQGEQQIILKSCQKFRNHLNKGPSLNQGKPTKILSLVLQNKKLGIVFINEIGEVYAPLQLQLQNDDQLKHFINDEVLSNYIKQYKPDIILISANCRRAQTLRKQLRHPNLFSQYIYCTFGQYQVPSLVAKKKKIEGVSDQISVLQAISMARLKKNPMAEILSLWNQKTQQNGVLSMNLHVYQKFINKIKLKNALQKVAIQVVNLVGLDLKQIMHCQHMQNQLQFLCGFGPRKSYDFLDRIRSEKKIFNRIQLKQFVSGQIVYKNYSPFFKIETSMHRNLIQKTQKEKKKQKDYHEINLLDMTRIPQQWYPITCRLVVQAIRSNSLLDIRQRKSILGLSEEMIAMIEIFKNPEKIRGIQWSWKRQENPFFDEQLVKSEIMSHFKNPREPEKVMQNRQTFYNLLRETPQTLKRYMVMTVKILSIKKQYLNVIIPQNGLFGYIKFFESKSEYEKGNFIKAIIVGFPFDEKKHTNQYEDQQQLLKVQMSLNFPHKIDDRPTHDCFGVCFPQIIKQIHPNIDLEKQRFDIKKQDRPIIQIKQQTTSKLVRTQLLRISHPKFKNISLMPAIELIKDQPIGQYVIRPSSQGPDYLVITWNFFKGIITHVRIKNEQKGVGNINYIYRIIDKDKDKIFNSLEDIIDKYIKPMNLLVQDVINSRKFLPSKYIQYRKSKYIVHLQQIEEKIKLQQNKDSTHIHYFFGCSEQFPQFFILIYMYKDKKAIKQLIRVRSSGLYFHDQQFTNLRDLINWFKEHLREKDYQRYAKNNAIRK